MQIDIRVMELLASKLCHDLVSPVSAINNGVELIQDIGGPVVDEAMKLIGDSGAKAARRLKFYRLAYGRAGSESNLTARDVRQIVEQYLLDTKISFSWPGEIPSSLEETRGFFKVMLNMTALGEELLAYGGVINFRPVSEGADGASGCRLEVIGRNASMNEKIQEAFEGKVSVDDLTPRSIQSYMTGRLAEHFGFKLSFDPSIPDRIDLLLYLPKEDACMQGVKVS